MSIKGRWLILWPETGWHDEAWLKAAAARVKAAGFVGVSLHCGLDAAHQALVHVEAAKTRADIFRDAGLKVAVGLGFPKPTPDDLPHVVAGIIAALEGGFDHVQLDWEGAWDGHEADGKHVVDAVLGHFRGVISCPCTSLCWWAPKQDPQGHWTHPHAPTDEFLRLNAQDVPVAPQVYNDGKADGATASQLAWSRRQYAPRPVIPTIQGYKHSVADRVALLLAEPDVVVWDYLEIDVPFWHALQCAIAIEGAGYFGAGAIVAFQAAHGLVADGIFGPKTEAALPR